MKKTSLSALLFAFFNMAIAQSTLYYNGTVFTGDTLTPSAGYFIVENGKIVKTGMNLPADSVSIFTNKVNLDGRTVLPGFVDSHIHFIDGALGLLQISLYDVSDSMALKRRLLSSRKTLIDGLYVARDLGFEPLKNVTSPLDLLDAIFPDVPAIIFLKSGHAAVANSAGMKKLGFTTKTTIPDGTIQKDKNGRLNGWLLEAAAMETAKQVSSFYSAATVRAAILKGQSLALSYGITTIGDNTFSPFHLKIYQSMQRAGELKMRVWARSYGRIPETDNLMSGMGYKKLGFIGPGADFSHTRYHAIKLFEDMSLSVSQDVTGVAEPGGTVFLNRRQLKDYLLMHPQSVFAFHVQGKKGLQNILDAVSEIGPRNHGRRHVIDHAGYASPELLQQANELGLAVTVIADQTFDYSALARDYKSQGASLLENDLLNVRAKYRMAHGALSSDFPYGMDTLFTQFRQVDGLNPFPNIAVNVSGKYPNGKPVPGFENKTLSTAEAIRSYTANGAYVLGTEKYLGKIAQGFKADFTVLNENALPQDLVQLYNLKVDQTFIDGKKIFDRYEIPIASLRTDTLKPVKPYDYALSPIFGYDPTVGFIYGAAAFVFPLQTPGNYFDAQIQASGKGNVAVIGNYMRFDLFRNVDFKWPASYTNFVQYYFGEGDDTRGEQYWQLFSHRIYSHPELIFKQGKFFRINLFADYRGRQETNVETEDGSELQQRLFPDENSLGFGAGFNWDTRDNSSSTKKGVFFNAAATYVPSALNVAGAGSATLLTAEMRFFQYLYTSKFVMAARIAGGTSLGTPSYLFRYSLGGSNQLRGYYSNRFRGERFYTAQAEFRFPIYGRFSGAGFIDGGDITDDTFGHFQVSYGGGIRFFIRDNVALRLDYGFGKDQNGLFFTFGEAF